MKFFGNTRKLLAFCLLAMGLYTFFMPLVSIHPAVMSRTEWSAWDICSNIFYGKLRPSPGMFGYLLTNIALQYLVMLIMSALTALSFSRSRKLLMIIGVVGIGCGIEARESGHQFFGGMFFPGSFAALTGAGVEYGPAMIAPSIIIAALVLISITEAIDPKYWSREIRGAG